MKRLGELPRPLQYNIEELHTQAQGLMVENECAECWRGHECGTCPVGIDSNYLDFFGLAEWLAEEVAQ